MAEPHGNRLNLCYNLRKIECMNCSEESEGNILNELCTTKSTYG